MQRDRMPSSPSGAPAIAAAGRIRGVRVATFGADPVQLDLAVSYPRPRNNVTGVVMTSLSGDPLDEGRDEEVPKHLTCCLLHAACEAIAEARSTGSMLRGDEGTGSLTHRAGLARGCSSGGSSGH